MNDMIGSTWKLRCKFWVRWLAAANHSILRLSEIQRGAVMPSDWETYVPGILWVGSRNVVAELQLQSFFRCTVVLRLAPKPQREEIVVRSEVRTGKKDLDGTCCARWQFCGRRIDTSVRSENRGPGSVVHHEPQYRGSQREGRAKLDRQDN